MTIFSRKPIMGLLAFSILLLAATCREPKQAVPLNLFDLQTRQSIAAVQAMDALKSARIVLVGEHHTDQRHHEAQLQVIRTLTAQSVPLSIGLEMFRKDSQAALDRWVAGELDEVPLGCILKYVEALKPGTNAEIGPKDIFETTSTLIAH